MDASDLTTTASAPLVVSRYSEAAAVLSAAQDFFAEDELLTSLPYGLMRRLSLMPDLYGAEKYFLLVSAPDPARAGAALEEPTGAKSRVVLLAMQTGRWPLAFFVSPKSPEEEVREAVVQLLRHLNESGQAKAVGCAHHGPHTWAWLRVFELTQLVTCLITTGKWRPSATTLRCWPPYGTPQPPMHACLLCECSSTTASTCANAWSIRLSSSPTMIRYSIHVQW